MIGVLDYTHTMEQSVAICFLGIFLITYLIPDPIPCQVQNLNRLALFFRTNVHCRDLNLDKERFICEVEGHKDWTFMMCSGNQDCKLSDGLDPCRDGSYNMTCLPLEGESEVYYRCGCHAVLEEGSPSTGEWTEWKVIRGEPKQRKFYEGHEFTCITEIAQSKPSRCPYIIFKSQPILTI